VVSALGERSIILFGGLLMAVGMAAVVFSPWDGLSPFGFALVAIGAANNIPVLIGAASRVRGTTPGAGVAAAATGALLGFLIGPPVIGFIAHAAGLATALGLLCLSGLIIATAAAAYRWPERTVAEPAPA
jgi:MFS family permease